MMVTYMLAQLLSQAGDWSWFGELVAKFGGVGAIALIVAYALYTGKLRLDREYVVLTGLLDEVKRDRNEWKDMALRGIRAGERLSNAADTLASKTNTEGTHR